MEEQHVLSAAPWAGEHNRTKALHVVVPEEAHYRARRAAVDSRMSFKKYMAWLMLSAQPCENGTK